MRTLERVGEVMRCECGKRYPIVGGVPMVMEGIGGNDVAAVVEDVDVEVQAMIVGAGADDGAYARMVEHLSIYLDAQWGDRAEPRLEVWGIEGIVERIRATGRVEQAVELGCSVGRVLVEMGQNADEVVGVELNVAAAKRARRLVAGETVAYNRRVIGKEYARASVRGIRADNVTVVAGDALDPPLVPGAFGRVVALNVLDSVSRPRRLLEVMNGLCARGGELIVSSPYAWQSSVMEDGERFGGADPAAALVAMLRGGDVGARYEIEEEADVPWHLRRDARSVVSYRAHYVRARKM